MTENEIAKIIVDVSLTIHRRWGGGILESAYEALLVHMLAKRGLAVVCQHPIPLVYEDVTLEVGFRADLIVEGKVIVEIKSVERLMPVHKKQLNTYLKLTGLKLGLLINFGGELLKGNVERIVNGLEDDVK